MRNVAVAGHGERERLRERKAQARTVLQRCYRILETSACGDRQVMRACAGLKPCKAGLSLGIAHHGLFVEGRGS